MTTITARPISTPAPGHTFTWTDAIADTYIVTCSRPTRPPAGKSKYGEAFAALDFDEAYPCEPRHTNRVATAMRKYVSTYEPGAVVETQSRCADGIGRVFKRRKL